MSIQLLILKNGVLTFPRSNLDIAAISVPTAAPGTNTNQIANCAFVTNAVAGVSTTNFVSIGGAAQTITGDKNFTGALQLPTTSGNTAGTVWRNGNNLEYKDGSNNTKILLNSAGNLSNLMDKQVSLNNLVGTQAPNRVLRSDGTNVTLSLVNLSTDVTNVLSIANGGTGSNTQTFVDVNNPQNVNGIKVFMDSTESTNTTTGGTRFLGGVGVAKNLAVGGRIIQAINHVFKAAANTLQTIPNAVWTKITFGSEIVDSNNQYTPANSRLTALTTETWRISLYITFTRTTTSRVLISVWKNGAEIGGLSRVLDEVAGAGDAATLLTINEFSLVANDYLEVYCYTTPSATVYGEPTLVTVFWGGKRID